MTSYGFYIGFVSMRLRRDGRFHGLLRTDVSSLCAGSVSIGFIHATPGDMKSFRSSAERMALIVSRGSGGGGWRRQNCRCATGTKIVRKGTHDALKQTTKTILAKSEREVCATKE